MMQRTLSLVLVRVTRPQCHGPVLGMLRGFAGTFLGGTSFLGEGLCFLAWMEMTRSGGHRELCLALLWHEYRSAVAVLGTHFMEV